MPAGRIYDVQNIVEDPHFKARDMLLESQLEDGTPVILPGILPKLSETPGGVDRAAPTLGQDTEKVLKELGIQQEQLDVWKASGII